MKVRKTYSFDDLLLVPKKTDLNSRDEVDLSVDYGKGIKTKTPIISANMKTVTSPSFAAEMIENGGMALLHRFTEDRIIDYNEARFCLEKKGHNLSNIALGVSIGIQDGEKEFIDRLVNETDCKIVCLDIAHAHSKNCLKMVEWIAGYYPDLLLIAGNVATGLGAVELAEAGANVIKAGIGGGSICSTRVQTGNGVPQFTAIIDAAEALEKHGLINSVRLVSDGGLKTAGNISKALCFADAVMLGTMLAGTNEAPGKVIEEGGVTYKEYVGSSTYKARYIEGITSKVVSKGPLKDLIENICDGIRSCCSYQGVRDLNALKVNPEFVELTQSGFQESLTHAIVK